MSDMRQVHADLVRTAGFERETHETYRSPGIYNLVVSASRTTVALDNGHLLPLLGMASNRCLNSALQCWEASTHQRHIAPLQLASFQLCGQMPMTAVVLGHQQESRRVFIEPMHNAWAFFPADARQRLAVKEQGINQSPTGMTRARMHHQARRFVDYQEGIVLIDNLQR
jgi:hypothetical protein